MITNTTYRFLVEKLGDSDPAQFVGNEGEVFYDPSNPQIFLSDGITAGGTIIGDNAAAESGWTPTATDTHTLKQVIIGSNTTTFPEELVVEGNARVTGILSVGTATIILDPSQNTVSIGDGIVLNANTNTIQISGSVIGDSSGGASYVGVVTAASLVIGEEPVSDTDVINWNTAYSWGNHASAGYLNSSSNTSIVPAVFLNVPTTQNTSETGFPAYTFTYASNVSDANDTITLPGVLFNTGDGVLYASVKISDGNPGTNIAGLAKGTLYYIITTGTPNVYRLATSYDNAIAGTYKTLNATTATDSIHTLKVVDVSYDVSLGRVFIHNSNIATDWVGIVTNTGLSNNQAISIKVIAPMGSAACNLYLKGDGSFTGNGNKTNIFDITAAKNGSGTTVVYGEDYPS